MLGLGLSPSSIPLQTSGPEGAIRSMFSNGEQGAWYDPSDLTTLYQDAAGTTPVTGVEQVVGLVLDKSKGLTLGTELVTNGTFGTTTTGWTPVRSAALSIVSGRLRVTNNGEAYGFASQQVPVTIGKTYKFVVANEYFGDSSTSVRLGTTQEGTQIYGTNGKTSDGVLFTATTTSVWITLYCYSAATTVSYAEYDNVSIREVSPNYAYATDALNRVMLKARYNLLTYTEDFSNAVWVRSASIEKTTATNDPFGGTNASRMYTGSSGTRDIYQIGTSIGTKASLYAKKAELSKIWLIGNDGNSVGATFDLNSGNVTYEKSGHAASMTPIGSTGWYFCSLTYPAGTIMGLHQFGLATADNSSTVTVTGNQGVYIFGADLRVANDGVGLPAYQRVASATDYDTVGFPPYLQQTTNTQFLRTGDINFSGTDKMTVFAGVRKTSDAAAGILAELSTSAGSTTPGVNPGSFFLVAPSGAVSDYAFAAHGSVGASAFQQASKTSEVAPITSVVTATGSISTDLNTIRVNAVAGTNGTADQGSGNYGTYPLYLFMRAGSSFPFTGRLYSLIIRGAESSAAQITSGEIYVNSKTRAELAGGFADELTMDGGELVTTSDLEQIYMRTY